MRVRGSAAVMACVIACVMAMAACAHEKTRAEIEAEDARRPDAGARRPDAPVPASGASELRRLAALDDSAKRFPDDPRTPGWLYAAGVEGAAHSFLDVVTAADSSHLASLPESYYHNEIAGSQVYTGWHLRELVRRFPSDTLADDAAYLVAQHHDFAVGECEGFFYCYLAAAVEPYGRFLRAHPTSPLVPRALAATDSALRANFDRLEQGQVEFSAVDTMLTDRTMQRHQVTSVDSTLQGLVEAFGALASAERDRAMAMLEPIRARWLSVRDRP